MYISIGPLRRLIYYLFVDYLSMNINWAAPMIDIFNLFVDYPPMNINWAAPTIDIFNLDYPPIINIFRQPSEPFSLDSSHALFSIVLGCSSAYGMHVCHFQYSLITCKYVNMHIFTKYPITQSCHVIIISSIKISSLGLMIKHEQFNLNHSAKHIFTKIYFENTVRE